jgi:AdoMet-dependent rRNA methyltransferase SPB1
LIQLNRKFGFLQPSQVCIDLCAAPGGWMQVAKQNMPVSSIVIGIDLFPIKNVPGCISLVEDITTDKCKAALTKELKTWKADVVLNDGAPNVGRNWIFDAYAQTCLSLSALKLATQFLRPGGWFITKVFRSKDYNAFVWVLKQLFRKVHATKPSASRKESAEIFVVCQYYKAPDRIDPKFLDAKYVFEELEMEPKQQNILMKETVKHHKKVRAEGYEGDQKRAIPIRQFIKADDALAVLQVATEFVMDDAEILGHRATTDEIVECCRDIKVLGRKELRDILRWQKELHDELEPTAKEEPEAEEGEAEVGELTEEQLEDKELDAMDKHIAELKAEEGREARRKKKKVNKEKAKLAEKMNLKMVIKGDEGPREEADDAVFNLKSIKTGKELAGLIDQPPDVLGEERPDPSNEFKPKFVKFDKESKGDLYEDDTVGLAEESEDSDAEFDKPIGLGIESDDEEEEDQYSKNGEADGDEDDAGKDENPLIDDLDHRKQDVKRFNKAQMWFAKDIFKEFEGLDGDNESDEEYDIKQLTEEYQSKGVKVLGADRTPWTDDNVQLGKKARKRQAKHGAAVKDSDESADSSDDENADPEVVENVGGEDGFDVVAKEPRQKKIKLTEEELALGTVLISSRKNRRELEDGAWNRYMFSDDNLPEWFVKDEQQHMRKQAPVPANLVQEYRTRVEDINVRSIKKVMEAKARKKRRAQRKLEKIKKKSETILESADNSNQEKIRAIKK